MLQHKRVLAASLAGTAVEFYDFYIYATAASLVFALALLPGQFARRAADGELCEFRPRLSRAPARRSHLRPLRRPYRPQVDARRLAHADGRIDLPDRLPAHACPDRVGSTTPALRAARGTRPRSRRRMGRCGPACSRECPAGMARSLRDDAALGAPIGFLAANGLFLLLGLYLSEADFIAWGWRLPFLASALLVGLGLWARLKLGETPEFKAALEKEPPPHVPIAEMFSKHARATLAGTLAVVTCFALFYISTAFALGHATTALKMPRAEVLQIQLGAILFLAVGIIAAGWVIGQEIAAPSRSSRVAPPLSRSALVFGKGLSVADPAAIFMTSRSPCS